jgi:uncharacterized membrane protein YgcG
MTAVRILKRRALVARLLACAVPVVLVLGGAASATATPVAPYLVTTNPPSSEGATAISTTPAILGEAEPEDGIILKRAPLFTASQLGPITNTVEKPTAHPNYVIKIFQSAECLGSVAAQGTAAQLEGSGIIVSVSADSATTFTAVQVDPEHTSEPSPCSGPLTYWEGNAPVQPGSGGGGGAGGESGTGGSGGTGGTSPGTSTPTGTSSGTSTSKSGVSGANPAGPKPAAPNLHMIPGERANDTTPSVAGGAPGASAVTVYASANCGGTPVAKGTPAQLGAGFPVSVPENAVTTFSAVSVSAQRSACSDPITYTEDSLAPRTRITMGPGVKTRKRKAVFRFTDITEDPPGTTFKCKVDKAKWKPCASPFRVKHLKLGRHSLQIRATDLAGNVEPKPVKRRFIVVPPAG